MPITEQAKQVRKLTDFANNEAKTPHARILAARRLLRLTKHSVRSSLVAKRVAKLFMMNDAVLVEIRKKAQSLYEFTIDHRETAADKDDSENLESPSVETTGAQKKPSIPWEQEAAILNKDWETGNLQWIKFRFPEELPKYGIPADPRFLAPGAGALLKLWAEPAELRIETERTYRVEVGGVVFYVEFEAGGRLWGIHQISNPQYIAARAGQHINWSCNRIDELTADGQVIRGN